LSDKKSLGKLTRIGDIGDMSKLKESEIYPKFEFRLSHQEKKWLTQELNDLKEKFSADGVPIPKNDLIVAALRHGLRYLRERKRLNENA